MSFFKKELPIVLSTLILLGLTFTNATLIALDWQRFTFVVLSQVGTGFHFGGVGNGENFLDLSSETQSIDSLIRDINNTEAIQQAENLPSSVVTPVSSTPGEFSPAPAPSAIPGVNVSSEPLDVPSLRDSFLNGGTSVAETVQNISDAVSDLTLRATSTANEIIRELDTSFQQSLDAVVRVATSTPQSIERARTKLQETKEKAVLRINEEVKRTPPALFQPENLRDEAQKALSSIEETVRQAGATVNFDSARRNIEAVLETSAEVIAEKQRRFNERGGILLYRDADGDGVSDYDEIAIYGTDPKNAYSAGTILTDGERILQGFDPTATSSEKIAYEDPRSVGAPVQDVYEITSLEVAQTPVGQIQTETIRASISGRALPFSFVTLFVYSSPIIVTVKTNSSGNWTYTLAQELPNGSHTIYLATVNSSGKIVAKSNPIFFTQKAEAYTLEGIQTSAVENGTESFLFNNFLIVSIFITALALIVAVIVAGLISRHHARESEAPEETNRLFTGA